MAILKDYSWLNADGLPIYLGLDEAILAKVTEYTTDGPERMIEVAFNATAFNATDEYLLSTRVNLPIGAQITRAQVGAYDEVFASSGGGTISLGVVDKDFASNNDIESVLGGHQRSFLRCNDLCNEVDHEQGIQLV